MNDESKAWRSLEEHAASQLRNDFASQVMRASRGPADATWRDLAAAGAAQLRPGFADRVLRAVRTRIVQPSFRGQLALGAATVACLLAAVVVVHYRVTRDQEDRNLASWEQLERESQYFAYRQ
jgi:hypothetical protein